MVKYCKSKICAVWLENFRWSSRAVHQGFIVKLQTGVWFSPSNPNKHFPNSLHLSWAFVHMWSLGMLIRTLWSKYGYPHLTDNDIKAWDGDATSKWLPASIGRASSLEPTCLPSKPTLTVRFCIWSSFERACVGADLAASSLEPWSLELSGSLETCFHRNTQFLTILEIWVAVVKDNMLALVAGLLWRVHTPGSMGRLGRQQGREGLANREREMISSWEDRYLINGKFYSRKPLYF